MTVMTLRDYAKKSNISYEAVRKQVVRYQEELAGHLIKDGRQQFLDEEAVAFLDAKRKKNPVAIYQMDKDAEIEDLRLEREQLLHKIAAQADRISELAEWKAENALLIASAEQSRFALAAAEKEKQQLEEIIQNVKAEMQVLTAEKVAEVSKAAQAAQEAAEREKAALRDLEAQKAENEAMRAKNEAMKRRSWWERLMKKDE